MPEILYPDYQEQTIPLDAIITGHEIGGLGDFFKVIELTHPEVAPVVRISQQGSPAIPLFAGQYISAIDGSAWERLLISTSAAATGGEMKVVKSYRLELGGWPDLHFDIIDEQIKTAAVTVGSTAVALNASVTGRHTIMIVNNDASVTLYIGASNVTSTIGIPVVPGGNLSLTIAAGVTLYGIAESNINVRVFEGK